MKKSILLSTALCLCIAMQAQNKLTVNADQGKDVISKHIYGHFSEHLGHCIYGGCFADEYHRMDGIGPRSQRPKMVNTHWGGVKMANIAQTINVLQAVILTDKEKMLLTPTYWVYYLYKVHQDATLLPVSFSGNRYKLNGKKIDAISVSASKDAAGKILTSARINDYNSFDKPNTVSVKDFKDAELSGGKLTVSLPAKSVVLLEIE
jgi:alpha-L-arabinofuranosidase